MSSLPFSHTSVLLWECIDALNIRPDLTYVDCTTGGGGHSLEIARRLSANGRLICLDRDEDALAAAKERLADYLDRVTFVHANFADLSQVLTDLGVSQIGGLLADLGCSSYQFDTPERGFSYQNDAPLDMRMDVAGTALTARQVVNTYSEADLKRILFDYGEEKFSARIAASLCAARAVKPIETTRELSELIKYAIPASARVGGPHPAKRTFQAIRIEVNGELDAIAPLIRSAADYLIPDGRIALISFHSLEDRIVKSTFAELAQGCTCPRDFPVCVCGKKPSIQILTKKAIVPTDDEMQNNPRSRSAKLRIAAKL